MLQTFYYWNKLPFKFYVNQGFIMLSLLRYQIVISLFIQIFYLLAGQPSTKLDAIEGRIWRICSQRQTVRSGPTTSPWRRQQLHGRQQCEILFPKRNHYHSQQWWLVTILCQIFFLVCKLINFLFIQKRFFFEQ